MTSIRIIDPAIRDHITGTARGFAALGLIAAFGLAGLTLAFIPIDRTRTYDLVQIDATGESEIVDYNLSATDCGQFRERLVNRGYHVLCERSN